MYTFTHCSNSLTPAAVLPEPEPPNCASYDIDVLRNNEDWRGAAVGPRYRAFMQRRADAPPSLFDGASCKDYAYFVHALFVNCAQSRGARLRLVQHVLRTSFNCTCKSWIELSALERDLLYDKAIDGLREVMHFRCWASFLAALVCIIFDSILAPRFLRIICFSSTWFVYFCLILATPSHNCFNCRNH